MARADCYLVKISDGSSQRRGMTAYIRAIFNKRKCAIDRCTDNKLSVNMSTGHCSAQTQTASVCL